ncbi:PAS domain-containing protein [Erythrobacter sp.]|jgi:hypothetical protein|uniref:PAS domain-containing protein n=1 Tax=Erythrobacter sp. TaxID=1042 RepID=UPI003FA59D89
MDTLRGPFDGGTPAGDASGWNEEPGAPLADDIDGADEQDGPENARDLPPEAIGQDERRMQVRAYNHWASLLGDHDFPSIEDLEPADLPDFGPHSVLLDFSTGIEDPVVQYLGDALGEECLGADRSRASQIERLSDVPPRSLLSRITDHYMQILANQAPIGFEAEFVNERGTSVLYRGILLPFSSDRETIDFVYGVINWKEMADAATADELLLAIDQAIDDEDVDADADGAEEAPPRRADPVTEWADSPAHEEPADEQAAGHEDGAEVPVEADHNARGENDNVAYLDARDRADEDASPLDLSPNSAVENPSHANGSNGDHADGAHGNDLPMPDFGKYGLDDYDDEDEDEYGDGDGEETGRDSAAYSFASLADYIEAPAKKALDLDAEQFDPDDYRVEDSAGEPEAAAPSPVAPSAAVPIAEPVEPEPFDAQAGLHDCLAAARALAQNVRVSEDRTRQALYEAVGRAYDVSLAASAEPDAYAELIAENGLTMQDRAPMTPVVKLVFGQDYDKTRLTEYAAVLTHAHRMNLERGALADYLREADGGLKGVVAAERRLRREEAGETVEDEGDVRAQLAAKLRELEEMMFDAISAEGPEFSLVMLRRDGAGNVALIGEIDDDVALIERAGKKLVG